jgi:hypothetical protein
MDTRLPAFIVPGAQKSGTTSLHQLLARHPEVYLPQCKEVHYFSLHAHEPVNWYAQHYAEAKPEQRCGDITPYYLFHPWVPERMAALLPQVKLVILLRDPVERCLSQYFHARRLGFETLALPEALDAEAERLAGSSQALATPGSRVLSHQRHSYLARSCYSEQLNRYSEHFSREQMLLLRSEDLFREPAGVWEQLLAWIDLAPIPLPGPLPQANAGRGEAQQVPSEWRTLLHRKLEPTYTELENQWGIRW